MMKKQKILININNLDEIEEYKKIGINNFLFALKGFSVGYDDFPLESIPKDSYVLINRVLDSKGIDELKSIKDELSEFRGVIFEDLGVYNALKGSVNLIWNQAHFGTNTSSINFWLSKCSSAVLSNEITKEEIKEIIDGVNGEVVFNVFGKNMIAYSRRTLLSNFNRYNNLDEFNNMLLSENITKNDFYLKENEYGTAIFSNDYFNYISFSESLNDDKIKSYLIYNLDLTVDKINSILEGEDFGNDGFLNKKTVYRMSEYTDREARK